MNQNDNLLNCLFKAVGIESTVRNFLVDYSDNKENSYHRPLQTVCIVDCTDNEIVNGIMRDLEKEHMTVDAITEVYGNHSLKDLSILAGNVNLLFLTGFKYLYLRNKKSH